MDAAPAAVCRRGAAHSDHRGPSRSGPAPVLSRAGGWADGYAEGPQQAGHQAKRIDLAQLDDPLLCTAADFERGQAPEVLQPAQAALLAAEYIVSVFHLWLGTMPALVKGSLEQVLRPGVAFAFQERGGLRRRWIHAIPDCALSGL